jgi:hypothetical protein
MCESTTSQNISETVECIDDLRKLKTEILTNNEFIQTKYNSKVIYLSNGEYFQTSCQKIQRVYVAQIFDKCTKDIFVYFYSNGKKTFDFLSTYGIIKSKSLHVECTEEYSTVQIDNLQFIKHKNLIKVNNLLPISEALKRKLNEKVEEKIADIMLTSLFTYLFIILYIFNIIQFKPF